MTVNVATSRHVTEENRFWIDGAVATLRGLVCAALVGLVLQTTAANAQGASPAAADQATLNAGQLEQVVAPIALYPDDLLSQVLMASTYPLEVVQAARWAGQNPGVTGKPLEDAMAKQTWDPSVKGLVAVPQTLQDVVIIYAAVTGVQDGELREENYVNKVYPQVIGGRLWSAIQVTTAAGITAVVDLVMEQPQRYQGFVAQERFRLSDRVLPDGTVEDEHRFVRRVRPALLDDAHDLLELVHQVVARVQTTGGVDDDDIGIARMRGVDRVERHCRGIATGLPANELRAASIGPEPQLIDGTGAKRVPRRNDDTLLLGPKLRGELADERRLSGAVHADDENDHRLVGGHEQRRITVAAPQSGFNALAQCLVKFVLVHDLPTLREPLDIGDETHGGRDPEIGFEQQFLELLEGSSLYTTARNDTDVGECDILDALPEGPLWDIPGALNYSRHSSKLNDGDQ